MLFNIFVGGSGKKLTDLQKEALADFGVSLADGAIENKSYALVTKWLEGVVKLAKQNLANANAIASNALAQSITVEPITLTDSSFVVAIKANDYWKFVDLGVKGTQKSNRAPNSPFRFKGNPIPIRPIQEWIAFKGIPLQGRDKQAAQTQAQDRLAAMQAAKAAGVAQYKELNKLSKGYGRNTLVDDAAILFSEWSDKTAVTNGEAVENTKVLDQTIAEYKNLLAQYGSSINPTELQVHQNTLSYLEQAREGKIPEIDGLTAWDLANPYSQEYNPATGQYSSTFEGVLNLAGGDAATAKEIESGGLIVNQYGDVRVNCNRMKEVNEKSKATHSLSLPKPKF